MNASSRGLNQFRCRGTNEKIPSTTPRPGNPQAGSSGSNQDPNNTNNNTISSAGLLFVWLAFTAYGFIFSPNQTPAIDLIYIKQAVTFPPGSTDLNTVFFSLFNMLGVYPLIFALLLIPGGRSGNKVPAWPFVTLSFGLGAFALLPYMAVWQPQQPPPKMPPPAEELEGWNRVVMKGGETVVLPAILLAASLGLWALALSAGADSWATYLGMFESSRLVHVSSVDFCALTVLMPFWMYNDAALRNWEPRDKVLPVLSLLPGVGPALYLLLRPKTKL